jgi:hypothetical protein
MEVLQVSFKYMSESISTAGEVGVVAIGPVANICVFLFLVCSGALFYKVCVVRFASNLFLIITRL